MRNPLELEEAYQHYVKDLKASVPDGIFDVDLMLLQELGLLQPELNQQTDDSSLVHNFYVIESNEKLTLFNQKFIVWIVPKIVNGVATTYILIALDEPSSIRLEMVFTTSGVYNHSNLVLQILEKFLEQIEENEKEICKLKD